MNAIQEKEVEEIQGWTGHVVGLGGFEPPISWEPG